jgi:hypothetical protein
MIGACTVYVFSSWALRAVGNAAQVKKSSNGINFILFFFISRT